MCFFVNSWFDKEQVGCLSWSLSPTTKKGLAGFLLMCLHTIFDALTSVMGDLIVCRMTRMRLVVGDRVVSLWMCLHTIFDALTSVKW